MSGSNPVLLKTYTPSKHHRLAQPDIDEIMRYGGMMTARTPLPPADNESAGTEVALLIDECLKEALPVLTYKVSYRYITIGWDGTKPLLPFDARRSVNLSHVLEGCTEGVMFAATIGVGIDRLITRYNHMSQSKALIMQAIGAERVEALCDTFNDEIRIEAESSGKHIKPRFSPGYGDLSLEVQKEFMVLLDCAHLIGVNLNESMLMSPSKSVTAVIGIYE